MLNSLPVSSSSLQTISTVNSKTNFQQLVNLLKLIDTNSNAINFVAQIEEKCNNEQFKVLINSFSTDDIEIASNKNLLKQLEKSNGITKSFKERLIAALDDLNYTSDKITDNTQKYFFLCLSFNYKFRL